MFKFCFATQVNTGAVQHSCTSSGAQGQKETRASQPWWWLDKASWLAVFIKGNNSSCFFIYYPTWCWVSMNCQLAVVYSFSWQTKEKKKLKLKTVMSLTSPLFCWSQWMPNGHYNGRVSLYKKVFSWLMLLNVLALHRTLNLTVIFWLPQVKNTKYS